MTDETKPQKYEEINTQKPVEAEQGSEHKNNKAPRLADDERSADNNLEKKEVTPQSTTETQKPTDDKESPSAIEFGSSPRGGTFDNSPPKEEKGKEDLRRKFDLPPTPTLIRVTESTPEETLSHNDKPSHKPAQEDEEIGYVDVTELQKSIDELTVILQESTEQQRELARSQKELITLQDKFNKQLVSANSFLKNFVRGIFSGFGVFVGSAILVALFVYILSLFDTAPIVGEYIERILNVVRNSRT